MPPRIYFHGYSIILPVNPEWEITEWHRSKKYKNGVSLFRNDPVRKDLTGSFSVNWIADLDVVTPELIMKELKCTDELVDTDRFVEQIGGCSAESWKGLDCVRVHYSSVDLKTKWAPGERYLMKGWELYCINPIYEPLVLKIHFSQRSAEKKEFVSLQPEIEKSLESLELDPIWK
jgi:hypothetical protein